MRRYSQTGFGTLFNLTAPTICRWENGQIPPIASAIPLLAILLCAAGIVRPQLHPPAWWKPRGQKKRRTTPKSTRGRACARSGRTPPVRLPDLFQVARLVPSPVPCLDQVPPPRRIRRVFYVAVSPNGVREATLLGDDVSTAMSSFHNALERKETVISPSLIEPGPAGQGLY